MNSDGEIEGRALGDGVEALRVERPESLGALVDLAGRLGREGVALFPQGGRTAIDFGGRPACPGVAVATTALERVVDYPAADMTVTVEAGITLAALQAKLAEEGQRLPIEAPWPERATLGGIFATDTCGPRRLGWGQPRDLIIGVGFATSQGTLARGGGRVVKNVAGYDFPKLLTGSLGALGVIAELTLKTRPKPEAEAILLFTGLEHDRLDPILEHLNLSATRPVAVELLNEPAARWVTERAALDFEPSGWTLGVGFEGPKAAVDWQAEALPAEVGSSARIALSDRSQAPVWSALADLPSAEAPVILKASLRPSRLVPFLKRLEPTRWRVQAHAANGIVWAAARDALSTDELREILNRFRAEASEGGGHVIVARSPADAKPDLDLWGRNGADWELAKRVKQALDPAGIMNPGRLF